MVGLIGLDACATDRELNHWYVAHRPVGRAVVRLTAKREIGDSNLWLVKSDTALPTTCYRCNISSKVVVLPAGAMMRRWAPQSRYRLQLNTAEIIKDLIFDSEYSIFVRLVPLFPTRWCVSVLENSK